MHRPAQDTYDGPSKASNRNCGGGSSGSSSSSTGVLAVTPQPIASAHSASDTAVDELPLSCVSGGAGPLLPTLPPEVLGLVAERAPKAYRHARLVSKGFREGFHRGATVLRIRPTQQQWPRASAAAAAAATAYRSASYMPLPRSLAHLRSFRIEGVQLAEVALRCLRLSTHLTCLTHLRVTCGNDRASQALHALLNDTSAVHLYRLRKLELDNSQETHCHDARLEAVRALRSPLLANLTHLDLTGFTSSAWVLSEVLSSGPTVLANLRILGIASNEFGEAAFKVLATHIGRATQLTGLQQLDASDNVAPAMPLLEIPHFVGSLQGLRLSTLGVNIAAVCTALQHTRMSNLQQLDLSNNDAGAQGMQQLCDMLQEATHLRLTKLDVSLTHIRQAGATRLAALLLGGVSHLCGLQELRASGMGVGPEGTEVVCSAVAAATHLTCLRVLDIGLNPLRGASAVQALVAALTAPHTAGRLQTLELSGCEVDAAAAAVLAEFFRSAEHRRALGSLQRLSLPESDWGSTMEASPAAQVACAVIDSVHLMTLKQLGMKGMTSVLSSRANAVRGMRQVLQRLPSAGHLLSRLEVLDLSHNWLESKDITAAIADALRTSTHLRSLHTLGVQSAPLYSRSITQEGAAALRHALVASTHLLSLRVLDVRGNSSDVAALLVSACDATLHLQQVDVVV